MQPQKPHLVDSGVLTAPAVDDGERLISIAYVQNDLGNPSKMTIWRWSRDPDPEVRFPAPALILSGKKRLWSLGTYRAWKARIIARGRIDTPRKGHADRELAANT
jgi:hypothetical protein